MYVAPEPNLVGVFFGRNEKLGAIAVEARLRPHLTRLQELLRLSPEQQAKAPASARSGASTALPRTIGRPYPTGSSPKRRASSARLRGCSASAERQPSGSRKFG